MPSATISELHGQKTPTSSSASKRRTGTASSTLPHDSRKSRSVSHWSLVEKCMRELERENEELRRQSGGA